MTAKILDGKALAKRLKAELAEGFAELRAKGVEAHLVSLSIGSDEASDRYVASQQKQAEKLGVRYTAERIPADSTWELARAKVHEICARQDVTGMILQLPLPKHLDANLLALEIDPAKNVEGIDPVNLGGIVMQRYGNLPCTARAAVELAAESGVEFKGARAVVVGRSVIVGKPAALLLLDRHCTVTVCHSRSQDLPRICREADILITAVGAKAGLVTGDWVKPGAVVVDVAIIEQEGRICGDVDQASVAEVAGWLSPVPGGVGPVTVQMLYRNTLDAARKQAQSS